MLIIVKHNSLQKISRIHPECWNILPAVERKGLLSGVFWKHYSNKIIYLKSEN